MLRLTLGCALVPALLLAAACQSSAPLAAAPGADGGPSDGTASEAAAADADAGPCTAPLSSSTTIWGTQGCPLTYMASNWNCFDAGSFQPQVSTQTCDGGFQAIQYDFATHLILCVYDVADGGALVGARAQDDVDSFCDHSTNVITYGRVDDLGSCNPPMPLPAYCESSDGGDDAATVDGSLEASADADADADAAGE